MPKTLRALPLSTLALLAALAAISIWGLSFIAIKVALGQVSPTTLIVVRFAVGAAVVGAVAWRRGHWHGLGWRDLPPLAVTGVLGIAAQQLLQVSGQATAEASVAAFMASTAPAFTVILAGLFLRETVRPWQWAGAGLATLGAIMVATNGNWAGLAEGQFGQAGNVLVLASAVVWAVFTLMNRQATLNRPATVVTAGMFFFGALAVTPLWVAQGGWRELAQVNAEGWVMLVGVVGVACTALAYLVNTWALKHLPASRVAVVQNLEPLVATAGATLLLAETVTAAMLVGGTAIVLGVYWAERATPPAVPATNPAQSSAAQ